MKTTYKVSIIGILTALYVVLSAFLKFNIFGNIMIDLGYVAFAVALCFFGPIGTVVGVIGCMLESLLFSAYGLSVSWMAANLTIGLICGFAFIKIDNVWIRIVIGIVSVLIGMLGIKTVIECSLYGIPLAVKIPKNAVAFAVDSVTLTAGILFSNILKKKVSV